MACGRRIASAIRSLVSAKDLKLECARILHETFLVPALMHGSETMLWKENERSTIKAVQMDNLRGLLVIKMMDRVPNSRIRELCGVKKYLDETIDEGMLRWFGQVERMERDRIAKRVYIEEYADSRSVGRPRKRWIDTMKGCLSNKQGEWCRIGVSGGGL